MRRLCLSLMAICIGSGAFALNWAKAFVGPNLDRAYSVQQTLDDGYIVAGMTASYGMGSYDFFLVKLIPTGDIAWAKTLGGPDSDMAHCVQQTSDSGYVIVGGTSSYGAGGRDFLVIKLTSAGNISWARTFGGVAREGDESYSMQQTSDGGYIITASTKSFGAGDDDFLVIKLTATGDAVWARTFGGPLEDRPWCVEQTSDGGYIVVGRTRSYGAGEGDFLVIKLTPDGDVAWARTFGGAANDEACAVQQTQDSGYVVAGSTRSYGAGNGDCLVIKLTPAGDMSWARTFGGPNSEGASSVQTTSDSGYIIAGSASNSCFGNDDFLIIKLNSAGGVDWARAFGGPNEDMPYSVQQTSDGGYVVVGETESYGVGGENWLVVRVEPDGSMDGSCPIQDCSPDTSSPSVIVHSPVPDTSSVSVGADCLPIATSPSVTMIDICGGAGVEGRGTWSEPQSRTLSISPNPFTQSTVISYHLQAKAFVSLRVYDLIGRPVETLVSAQQEPGDYSFRLNSGKLTRSIYFAKLIAGRYEVCEKLILMGQ